MPSFNSWDDLTSPRLLKHLLWVRVFYNNEELWFLCPRCELTEIRVAGDQFFDAPVECLLASGAQVANRDSVPERLSCSLHVIPAKYVVYIGFGPDETEVGFDEADAVVIAPNEAPAPGLMALAAIRATLAELSEPLP